MSLAKLLSLAFVMIAGPQFLTALFLATTKKWRPNSLAFIGGAGLSITAVTTIAFLLGIGASNQGASHNTIDIVVLVLLIAAAVHTFLTRKQSEPPKWMGKLEAAQPKESFRLGFLLLGVFPTDIFTSFAVGGSASNHDEPWWHLLIFVLLTLLLLASPALLIAVSGQWAQGFLPKARDWMNNNSWIVSEIVIALFVVLTAKSLA
ncbi:MAG: GAP family protein [Mycobacteriaceae bacterium]